MASPQLILASQSPRRKEFLASLGIPFSVEVSAVPELPGRAELAEQYVLRLAREKCRAVALRFPGNLVLAADTVVVLRENGNELILEKPRDASDAFQMLRRLQGKVHSVLTGFCLQNVQGEEIAEVVSSEVEFIPFDEKETEIYVQTGEPLDKAGAYAIQGGAARFVKRISGSYTSIVGLPLAEVYQALRKFHFVP